MITFSNTKAEAPYYLIPSYIYNDLFLMLKTTPVMRMLTPRLCQITHTVPPSHMISSMNCMDSHVFYIPSAFLFLSFKCKCFSATHHMSEHWRVIHVNIHTVHGSFSAFF